MKTLFLSAILLSSFVSVPLETGNPSNPEEPLIVRSQAGITGLEVILANLEQEATKISLTDLDKDEVYFSEVIRKHNGYSMNLQLDKLPEGRYLLSVKKGEALRRQVLLKTEAGLMCSAWK